MFLNLLVKILVFVSSALFVIHPCHDHLEYMKIIKGMIVTSGTFLLYEILTPLLTVVIMRLHYHGKVSLHSVLYWVHKFALGDVMFYAIVLVVLVVLMTFAYRYRCKPIDYKNRLKDSIMNAVSVPMEEHD